MRFVIVSIAAFIVLSSPRISVAQAKVLADSGKRYSVDYSLGISGASASGISQQFGGQYFFRPLYLKGRDLNRYLTFSIGSSGRLAGQFTEPVYDTFYVSGFAIPAFPRNATASIYFHTYDISVGFGRLISDPRDTMNPTTWLNIAAEIGVTLSMITSQTREIEDSKVTYDSPNIIVPSVYGVVSYLVKLRPSLWLSLDATPSAMLIPHRHLPGFDEKLEWIYLNLALSLKAYL